LGRQTPSVIQKRGGKGNGDKKWRQCVALSNVYKKGRLERKDVQSIRLQKIKGIDGKGKGKERRECITPKPELSVW
jgi:hypothetical protein